MARNFGVIGSPIGHSKSPALHRAAITALGIDASYGLTDVTDKELETYVKGLDQSWEGMSLTMPVKQAVRPLLSRQCHLSVLTGSVNTIVRRTNGWHGFNTDVWGATTAIRESFGGEFERAILLGAGATAASLVVSMHDLGVEWLDIVVRDPTKTTDIEELARRLGIRSRVSVFGDSLDSADLLVSSLPATAELSEDAIESLDAEFLFDVVYDPWPSALGTEWTNRGLESMGGLPMLMWQAVRQARVFYGESVDQPLPDEERVVATMRAAVGL